MYQEKGCLIFISSLLILFTLPFSSSLDTITTNNPLQDGEILVSEGGTFALGFFTPTNSSTSRYVGVWFNRISVRTIVWVANRDNPLNGTSGVLSIDTTGNLVLRDQNDSSPIWSTNANSSSTTNNFYTQLLDSGNLVLFSESGGGGGSGRRVEIWQSFDYPTDTMLPNLKLGLDKRTGLERFITSWRSPDDPGTGAYTYRMDVRGSPQMVLSRGSTRVWRSGPWNGINWSGIQMTPQSFFNASYVDNEDEAYLMFGSYNVSILSRVIVSASGTISRVSWVDEENQWNEFYSAPSDQCDDYGHCGPFGYCDLDRNENGFECTCLPGYEPRSASDWFLREGARGCVRMRRDQICQSGEGFVKLTNISVPDTSTNTTRVNRSLGLEACAEMCQRDCTCTGYTSANISDGGSGCIAWYGDMIDTRFVLNGQQLFVRVDAIELARHAKSRRSGDNRMTAIVVPSVVIGAAILSLSCWMLMKRKRGKIITYIEPSSELCSKTLSRRRTEPLLFDSNTSNSYGDSASGNLVGENGADTGLPFYSLSTLIAATDNFSIHNKLGEGGFGYVYKGELSNGQEIAVKKLSKNSGQGMEEFKNEVTLIAKLQHRNLVRLLGYCVHQREKMLIYEYMPNRGLDSFIFDKDKAALLDWRKRFEITMGIARGMLYLHQDSRLRIIHRDLKANNVLLDASMTPKISDFGMAKIFGSEQMEATTNRIVGTYGYMAPEYAMEGLFSIKSDVFSFGVLLLEIISGRKNNSFYLENSVNIIGHVWGLWIEGRALDIVDISLGDSYRAHELMRCIHVGLLCVQEFASNRPTMSEVAFMLGHETTLPSPKEPAFVFKNENFGPVTSLSATSVNDITITVVGTR